MNKLCWYLTLQLARLLKPGEREAVLGDLAESARPARRKLLDMLGLVTRRQLILWSTWQPWLILLTLIVPAAFSLQRSSSVVQGALDLYLWIIRNRHDLDSSWLSSIGLSIAPGVLHAVELGATTMLNAWIFGYILAKLSRRTLAIHALLLCLLSALLETAFLNLRTPYLYDTGNSPPPLFFYTLLLPFAYLLTLVFLPALFGIYQSKGTEHPGFTARILLWAAAILAPATFTWRWSAHGPLSVVVPLRIISIAAALWPPGFMLLTELLKLRSHRTT
jgi:hypothetical protein